MARNSKTRGDPRRGRERQMEGIAAAKAAGVYKGARPRSNRTMSPRSRLSG